MAAIVYDGTLPPQHTGEPSDRSAQVEERPLLMAMSPVSGSWPCVGVGVGASMALSAGVGVAAAAEAGAAEGAARAASSVGGASPPPSPHAANAASS